MNQPIVKDLIAQGTAGMDVISSITQDPLGGLGCGASGRVDQFEVIQDVRISRIPGERGIEMFTRLGRIAA